MLPVRIASGRDERPQEGALAKCLISWLGALLIAGQAAAQAGSEPDATRISPAGEELRTLAAAYCQRNRVVWSGGHALRGPDRLRPRPIRSKWHSQTESRLRCPEGAIGTRVRSGTGG